MMVRTLGGAMVKRPPVLRLRVTVPSSYDQEIAGAGLLSTWQSNSAVLPRGTVMGAKGATNEGIPTETRGIVPRGILINGRMRI